MGRQRSIALVEQLAVALASGTNATTFARRNGLEPRTVRNWARLPECREMVEIQRARIVDQTIGVLVRHAVKSVRQIARIAEKGETDAVKLSAAKMITDKLIEIQNHTTTTREIADLAARLLSLEENVHAKEFDGPDSTSD